MVHARIMRAQDTDATPERVLADGTRSAEPFVGDATVNADASLTAQPKPAAALLLARRRTALEVVNTLLSDAVSPLDSLDDLSDGRIELTAQISLAVVTSQRAALERVKANPPNVVMVEVDQGRQSRVRFCRMLRNRVPAMTILAVGRERTENLFEFDGFLALPLTERRIAAVVNKARSRFPSYVIERGPFCLDLATRTVDTPNGSRHVTPKLCALLEMLMSRHGEVVSRSDLMESIWKTSYLEDTRTLDVHIHWLRECIEPDPSNPKYLLTVRGAGYTFQTP